MWPGDSSKQSRYRRLFDMLGLPTRGRVLEVGCGAGGASRFFADTNPAADLVIGVDPSQLAVAEATRVERPGARRGSASIAYLAMDGRQLAFADGTFDAVFCTRVLIHALEPGRIVSEMKRVLRAGGRMLLVEPDRDGLLSSVECDQVSRAFWATRRSVNPRIGRELYPLLRELGMTVEHVEPRFNLSRQPPGDEQVRSLEQELRDGRGEWWTLVESGRVTAEELRVYVEGLRRAVDTGVYLRTDLELAYLARKIG
ncbi:MAG: methyltransferase domain-containing protein, partial [Chloroflexota bacterium]